MMEKYQPTVGDYTDKNLRAKRSEEFELRKQVAELTEKVELLTLSATHLHTWSARLNQRIDLQESTLESLVKVLIGDD